MARDAELNQKILDQILDIVYQIQSGNYNQTLQVTPELKAQFGEFGNQLNAHLQNLQQLEKNLPQLNKEITRLITGIHDVLQTIEKASIRVLDNTDGILEQHDVIENTIKLLKQNPAINRVIGKRLDLIQQAQNKARMFVFDIIQAQEFQELTKKQIQTLLKSLEGLVSSLSAIQKSFSIKDEGAVLEEEQEETEVQVQAGARAADQDSVDQLLAEFGL